MVGRLEPDETEAFLQMLPQAWRDELEQWMRRHPGEPELFGVFGCEATGTAQTGGTARTGGPRGTAAVLGGGAVFRRSLPPGMEGIRDEASRRLSAGEAYIGFLWVAPQARGRGLGRLWIEEVTRASTGHAFWLTVEDAGLIPFYETCGFISEGERPGAEGPEWLLSRASAHSPVSHARFGRKE